MTDKILIVDDDIDSLKLIGLMLQRQGYEVLAANAGKPAIAKAEAEHPQLIILDIMMPDMSGLEVCRRLRSNPTTADIPIIMFTAKTLIDDKVKGFEAGADDYLTKPTHPAELASRVKAILARNISGGAVDHSSASAKPRGEAIGIIGAKGGVGTTTVTANIAAALMQSGENCMAADFQLGVGTLGLSLGLTRSQGMARLFSRPISEITSSTVTDEMVTHQSGLRLLLSSSRIQETEIAQTPEAAKTILNAMREIAKPIVCDLGSRVNNTTATLLAEMNEIILVVEPNPVTLRVAQDLLKFIESNAKSERISIAVLNRSQSGLQTPWHEIETQLGRDVRAIISAAPELSYQAIENQIPAVLLQPGSVIGGQYLKLAEEIKTRIRPVM